MKHTINRLIKVITSLLTVAMIILAGCIVPALAAPSNILHPSDFEMYVENRDGVIWTSYRFDTTPYFRVYTDDVLSNSYSGSFHFATNEAGDSYRVRMYPFGNVPSTSTAAGTVLDVSDFKDGSIIGLTYSVQLSLDFYMGGNSNLTFDTVTAVTMYWYGADYGYIGPSSTSPVVVTHSYGDPTTVWVIQNSFDMTIPAGAEYCAVMINCRIVDPTTGNITDIATNGWEYFDIVCQRDAVIENSETMHRIEEKLEDLIDKADTFISGSEEDQAAGEAMKDQAQNAQQDMDEALSEMEKLPQVDTGDIDMDGLVTEPTAAPDIDLTFDDLVTGEDYKVFNNFFLTISRDDLWIKMMIIVCTMIWLTVLLYGKRG